MAEDIKLLDAENVTLEMIERYVAGRKARRDSPNTQDVVIDLICRAIGYSEEENESIERRLDRIEETLGDILIRTIPKKSAPLPRGVMLIKERCQTIAKLLWAENPNMTIAEVARHEKVFNIEITGGKNYEMRTVRDWVAEVFPANQEKQIGRPRKKAG